VRTILLDLEYDGTDFRGSQIQARGRTVQGELERALHQLTQQETRVALAGRTDAGVHARGQRATFETVSVLPLATFVRGLNALLPADVAVQRSQEVAEGFHARFSAMRRAYRYTLYRAAVRSPLTQRYAWVVGGPLDVAAMEAGLELLLGERDFASFAGGGRASRRKTTVRHVYEAGCECLERWVFVDVVANAFLRQMVRNIVGLLVSLGQGRCTLEQFEAIRDARDRRQVGPPAPPQGLCLMRVEYDSIVE
jgi:tRNA pseudouridine38-40 synthase